MDDNQLAQFRSNLNLYTPLHEAKEEIWRRWNDKALREKVSAYLGDIPEFFGKSPHATLWRFIATPNFEAQRFLELSSQVELTPIFLELTCDKFVTLNPDKFYLGKLVFCQTNNGSLIESPLNIIDITENQGKPINTIKTHSGSHLTVVHRELMNFSFLGAKIIDISSLWCSWNESDKIKRYERYLAFNLCHGILFENFIIKASRMYEYEFTRDIVLPAFHAVEKEFGLRPLIVPLFTEEEEEEDLYWNYYPGHLKQEVDKLMNGTQPKTYAINVSGK